MQTALKPAVNPNGRKIGQFIDVSHTSYSGVLQTLAGDEGFLSDVNAKDLFRITAIIRSPPQYINGMRWEIPHFRSESLTSYGIPWDRA
jgi:hypothetical protein